MSVSSPTDEPGADHPHPGGRQVIPTTGAADEQPPASGEESLPGRLDDPAVTAAVRAHTDAEVALVEAKHELARAREEVRAALFAAGRRYRDQRLCRGVVHHRPTWCVGIVAAHPQEPSDRLVDTGTWARGERIPPDASSSGLPRAAGRRPMSSRSSRRLHDRSITEVS